MSIYDIENLGPAIWFWDVKDQLKQHVYGRSIDAFRAGDISRDEVITPEQLENRKQFMRARFIESIGGLPSSDCPLNANITGTIQCNGFRIEKIIFESRPKAYVTANLYIPDGITEPRGAVIFACGHHALAKQYPEYQAVSQRMAKAGLVVLAQDPIGQGERFSYWEPDLAGPAVPECVPEHDYVGTQCLMTGDSLARYFVHDIMRGVDYLSSRPEVDPTKIGITGNSGGGTQTSLMMIIDPRIAAAAPGTFIMNRETYLHTGQAQDAEQIWPGMSALGFDHEDILLGMCPRPVMVVAVTWDFFPIEGTRRTVDRCKRFWEMHGAGDLLGLSEDESDHMYTDKLAITAAKFFAKHLLGKSEDEIGDLSVNILASEDLWATKSGQVRADYPDYRAAWEENVDRSVRLKAEQKPLTTDWLKERVLANRRPVEQNLRILNYGNYDDLTVQGGLWWSQEGLFSFGKLFRKVEQTGKKLPVTIAIWNGGSKCLAPHMDWIRSTCEQGRAVLVLDVSGIGAISPNPTNCRGLLEFYGTIHKLACDLIWLDDSLPALRTYDVLRTIDVLHTWPQVTPEGLEVYTDGSYGIYGYYASLIDSRINRLSGRTGLPDFPKLVGSRYYNSDDIYSIMIPNILMFEG